MGPLSHVDFVHLRVHPVYSLSEGMVRIRELVSLCEQSRMSAVAVTESVNLFGAMEFASCATNAVIQPFIGTLLAVGGTHRHPEHHECEPAPTLLLVQSRTGYRNLLELVSASFLETSGAQAPHAEWNRLQGHTDGLIALSGGRRARSGAPSRTGKRTLQGSFWNA